MVRLIGLVVVVLFVLSLAHGERSGAYDRANARAETLVDAVTARLADGVRDLGDLLFGPGPGFEAPDLRGVARGLDQTARTADAASRRAFAEAVLRACPSLGLSCRPAATADDGLPPPRRPPDLR